MSKVCKYHESIKCRNDGECDGCKVAPHGNTLDPVVSEHPTSHHIKCWLGFGPAKTERENMAIRKAYEISCDECGLAEPAHGNKSALERMWKAHGWLFVGDKHFCDSDCMKKHCKPNTTGEAALPAKENV